MRISANNTDVSWDVWLDGVLQKFVVTADDDLGEVERFAFNSDGSARVNGDSLETELVHGKVEILRAKGPVWSDSGPVPVGDVTYTYAGAPVVVSFDAFGPVSVDEAPNKFGPLRTWLEGEFTKIARDCPGLAEVLGVTPAKAADPNAKPALPALTRVSGNKRGPGWCDE